MSSMMRLGLSLWRNSKPSAPLLARETSNFSNSKTLWYIRETKGSSSMIKILAISFVGLILVDL